jgi:hypothetical protein
MPSYASYMKHPPMVGVLGAFGDLEPGWDRLESTFEGLGLRPTPISPSTAFGDISLDNEITGIYVPPVPVSRVDTASRMRAIIRGALIRQVPVLGVGPGGAFVNWALGGEETSGHADYDASMGLVERQVRVSADAGFGPGTYLERHDHAEGLRLAPSCAPIAHDAMDNEVEAGRLVDTGQLPREWAEMGLLGGRAPWLQFWQPRIDLRDGHPAVQLFAHACEEFALARRRPASVAPAAPGSAWTATWTPTGPTATS